MLLTSLNGVASEVLGFPLDEPLALAATGASRDGAPALLKLQHSALLPSSAAATQQWEANAHWWYAEPLALPERLSARPKTLQLALNDQRQLFWLLLEVAATDCAADREWLQKALSARYQIAALSDPTATAAELTTPLLYRSEDGTLLVTASCAKDQLHLEYLLPERYQRAYTSQASAADPKVTSAVTSSVQAQVLADQSAALLRGTREALDSWLGIALLQDAAIDQPPGPAQAFDPQDTAFAYLAENPLLTGASHTLETDIKGGITRTTTVLPDANFVQQKRWQTALRTRFGKPAKDTAKHQVFRFGDQRLVLRSERGTLRIAYQNLTRRKAERDRLAAQRAERYRESIKGL
ncbi:MAG: hypothetical protein AB8B93_01640 [Pseudomonadales bacterium]